MKVSWHDLTPDEQATFGNGCTWVPDFHYTASCRHHDWNYLVGSYGKLVWSNKLSNSVPRFIKRIIDSIEFIYRGLKAKLKADWGMCKAMWHDSHTWWHYVVTIVYWSGLTLLPFPYFFFRWGHYLTKKEALLRDKLSKMRRGIIM